MPQLQSIISIFGAVLVLAGVGGVTWLGASELRLRAIRRGRMQAAGGPQSGFDRTRRGPTSSIGTSLLRTIRTLGESEYSDGFPDLLALLVASVEAGLSLDAAVTRVTEELARRYPNLTVHLRFLVLELRAGKSRKDAWAAFADRLGIDDARQL